MGQTGFCENLRFPVGFCENLRLPAVFCENLHLRNAGIPMPHRTTDRNGTVTVLLPMVIILMIRVPLMS